MLAALCLGHPLKSSKAAAASLCFAAACVAQTAPAAAAPRYAAMAIDANTGSVLHNQAGDEPRYPASLTKMMTLYLTFELIERGRLSYSSTIKMTQEGADAAPSKLEVKPGTELTVLDAAKALITKSANDVAIALAQHIAGSEANFAQLMTRKAREIGMSNTTFKNASGLPDPEQVTTAHDMLTLALHLRDDFPRHYELFSTRVFNYDGDSYRNHNMLLGRYRGTDGIKTGYTRLSGFNLVTSVNRDGKRVVAAVFGGRSARARDNMMEQVLNKALAKASTQVTRKPMLVARAPQPNLARRPAPPPPPAAVSAPPPTVAQAGATDTGNGITMAKVRRVLIGSDAKRAQVAANDVAPSSGQPPSTLQAQAQALANAPPARPAPATAITTGANVEPRADAKQRVAAREARGAFEIQIGAFADPAEAERNMATARQRAGGILDSYSAVAEPAQKGTGQIYRARFKGFDATAAASACGQLKKLQIDCFVVKAE